MAIAWRRFVDSEARWLKLTVGCKSRDKPMRILITGVSGQVGGALASYLRRDDVIAADRSVLDLRRQDEIAGVLDIFGPELIINAAAYTAVDEAESHQDLARLVNIIAPERIARWGAAHNIPVVHFSTDYVFDGRSPIPWREIDNAAPLSVYGKTKFDGELAARAAGGSFLNVRLSWIYSAIGKSFMGTIARLAQQREVLRIVADQVVAPTSANLVARSVALMIGNDLDLFCDRCAKCDGLIHLAASGETSWHGFSCAVVEGLRSREVDLAVQEILPIMTSEYPTPAKRPHNSRLALTQLASVFGIHPADWRQPLKQELDLLATEMRADALIV
jgi:dTDP-4-dehydrorhamnose reductase